MLLDSGLCATHSPWCARDTLVFTRPNEKTTASTTTMAMASLIFYWLYTSVRFLKNESHAAARRRGSREERFATFPSLPLPLLLFACDSKPHREAGKGISWSWASLSPSLPLSLSLSLSASIKVDSRDTPPAYECYVRNVVHIYIYI